MAVNICEVYTFQVSNFMNKLKSKTNIQLDILIQITFNFHFFLIFSLMNRYLAYNNLKQKLFNSLVNLHKFEKIKMGCLSAHFLPAQVSFGELNLLT